MLVSVNPSAAIRHGVRVKNRADISRGGSGQMKLNLHYLWGAATAKQRLTTQADLCARRTSRLISGGGECGTRWL